MYLAELFEHPLKSGRGNLVTTAQVRPEGLAHDRRFLAHTADGTFMSGRSHPRLVQVSADWNGRRLILRAPGQEELLVLPERKVLASVAVWKDRFTAWDQGNKASAWLSTFLEDEVRLAWLGESQRQLRWDHDRRVTFADAAPLLAISHASLEDLSQRVGQALSMRRFRPNLVLAGLEAFEEDRWRRFRVGKVEFQNLDGCSRCEFTTIDPETAERHPLGEPVKTLERYRQVDTGIYFGMNLMPVSGGTLRVGDEVSVLETRKGLQFAGFTAKQHSQKTPSHETVPGVEEDFIFVCRGVRDEAKDLKTFVLEPQEGHQTLWLAGQYLKIRTPAGDRRCYTISSAPGSKTLEITVKRLEGGVVSTWLHQGLRPGSELVSEGICGQFTLENHPWNSLLLLGAGSGMTPLMAIVRDAAAKELDLDIALHQSATDEAELLFVEELKYLQRQERPRLSLGIRVTSIENHLDYNSLLRFCPDLRDRRAFVCGPDGYRAKVRGILADAGLKLDRRYHEELYGAAALEVPPTPEPGQVTFSRAGKTVTSDGATTVLQLAERAGIAIASSCRSGDCGTCRVQRQQGEWLLACHTFPQGDASYNL